MASRIGYGTPPIVTDGLTLLLDAANPKSYVAGSTAVNDLSGYRNNGTLVNGVGFTSSDAGIFTFDGTNDTINLGVGPTTLGMDGSFSVSVAFKNSGLRGGIVSSNTGTSLGYQYELSIGNNGAYLSTTFYGGGSINAQTELNKWYIATHTFDNSNKSSKLYVNGVFITSTTMATSLLATSNLIIGWYGYGGAYFNGQLSNVMIYNKALSSTDVLQNYNSLKSRFGL